MGIIKEGRFPEPGKKTETSPKQKTTKKDKELELSPEEMHLNQKELEERMKQPTERERAEQTRVAEFESEQSERQSILDELKKKEEESAKTYNEIRGKNDASRGFLKKMFGSGSETSQEVSDVRLIWLKDLEEWGKQSFAEVNEKLNRGEITSEDFEIQRLEIRNNIALRIAEVRGRETQKREEQGIKRGWLSEKVVNGSKYILEKYKKLPFLAKLGLGVGFGIAGGYYAVAGLGAMRFLGGIISGKATHDKLQSSAEWWRKKSSLKNIAHEEKQYEKEGLSIQEKLERTMKSLEDMSEKIDAKAKEEGYFDVVRKLGAWTIGGIVGSGTLARVWSELGIGRAVSEKIQHLLGMDHAVAPGVAGVKGMAPPEGAGKGALIGHGTERAGYGDFSGDTTEIRRGGSIWRSTRELFIKHPDEYGYNDGQAKRLFGSFREQGILRRLGIRNIDDFNSLTSDQKHKIWAEWKTASAIKEQGITNFVVHPGDSVTLDAKGHILFGETSGIKAGHLHHDISQGPKGAVAENYGRGGGVRGGGAIDTSHFDQQIEAARARGVAAELHGKSEVARLGAEAQVLNEQAIAGLTSANARLWNSGLEKLGGFRLNTPASQIQEAIGRLSPGITSDMPLPPTASEMIQRGNIIRFTQEAFQRFPTLNGRETMQQYLERMSRANFHLFKALSIKNRL